MSDGLQVTSVLDSSDTDLAEGWIGYTVHGSSYTYRYWHSWMLKTCLRQVFYSRCVFLLIPWKFPKMHFDNVYFLPSSTRSAFLSTQLHVLHLLLSQVQFVQPNTLWNGVYLPWNIDLPGVTLLKENWLFFSHRCEMLIVHAYFLPPMLEFCLARAWTCFMLQDVTNTGNSYCSNMLLSCLCLENILLVVICYLWLVLQSFCPFCKDFWVFEGGNVMWCPI